MCDWRVTTNQLEIGQDSLRIGENEVIVFSTIRRLKIDPSFPRCFLLEYVSTQPPGLKLVKFEAENSSVRDQLFLTVYRQLQSKSNRMLVKKGLFYEYGSMRPLSLEMIPPHSIRIGDRIMDLLHSQIHIYLGMKHPDICATPQKESSSQVFSLVIVPGSSTYENKNSNPHQVFHLKAISGETRSHWLKEFHDFIVKPPKSLNARNGNGFEPETNGFNAETNGKNSSLNVDSSRTSSTCHHESGSSSLHDHHGSFSP